MNTIRRYRPLPPASSEELMQRCIRIAGRTVGKVAALYHVTLPPDLKHARGFVGRLLEQALGACGAGLSGARDRAEIHRHRRARPPT